jgi:general L-amino acid transport system permease protein
MLRSQVWSRHRSKIVQGLLLTALAATVLWLGSNLATNLERLGTGFGFEALTEPAGFPISETVPLPWWTYTPESSYWAALMAGLLNTLKVSIAALLLALFLGSSVGTLRVYGLSDVRLACRWFVTVIRALPVLLQLIIWYTLIVGFLPAVAEGLRLLPFGTSPDGDQLFALHLNNRGLFLAYPEQLAIDPRQWVWNTPLPTFGGRNLTGGFHLTPEFLALFLGLGVYTSAFVAEIVRGGLQAVDAGQREAAAALGFSRWQTLRFIVAPQAMKVVAPPLASQCLSLVKNSSLAVAVGYPDLVAVGGTILNQTGRSLEIILVWMGVYLMLSVGLSALVNRLGRRRRSQPRTVVRARALGARP